MPILKYVPPTKKILDHRNSEGEYYEAECEICGTKFYPKRSTGKYCNPNCRLIAHRAAVANRNTLKGVISGLELMKIDFGRGNAKMEGKEKVSVKECLAKQKIEDERVK